jgi:hypothetical protein
VGGSTQRPLHVTRRGLVISAIHPEMSTAANSLRDMRAISETADILRQVVVRSPNATEAK